VSIIQIIQISLSANVIVVVVTNVILFDVVHPHIKANDDERHLRLRKKMLICKIWFFGSQVGFGESQMIGAADDALNYINLIDVHETGFFIIIIIICT